MNNSFEQSKISKGGGGQEEKIFQEETMSHAFSDQKFQEVLAQARKKESHLPEAEKKENIKNVYAKALGNFFEEPYRIQRGLDYRKMVHEIREIAAQNRYSGLQLEQVVTHILLTRWKEHDEIARQEEGKSEEGAFDYYYGDEKQITHALRYAQELIKLARESNNDQSLNWLLGQKMAESTGQETAPEPRSQKQKRIKNLLRAMEELVQKARIQQARSQVISLGGITDKDEQNKLIEDAEIRCRASKEYQKFHEELMSLQKEQPPEKSEEPKQKEEAAAGQEPEKEVAPKIAEAPIESTPEKSIEEQIASQIEFFNKLRQEQHESTEYIKRSQEGDESVKRFPYGFNQPYPGSGEAARAWVDDEVRRLEEQLKELRKSAEAAEKEKLLESQITDIKKQIEFFNKLRQEHKEAEEYHKRNQEGRIPAEFQVGRYKKYQNSGTAAHDWVEYEVKRLEEQLRILEGSKSSIVIEKAPATTEIPVVAKALEEEPIVKKEEPEKVQVLTKPEKMRAVAIDISTEIFRKARQKAEERLMTELRANGFRGMAKRWWKRTFEDCYLQKYTREERKRILADRNLLASFTSGEYQAEAESIQTRFLDRADEMVRRGVGDEERAKLENVGFVREIKQLIADYANASINEAQFNTQKDAIFERIRQAGGGVSGNTFREGELYTDNLLACAQEWRRYREAMTAHAQAITVEDIDLDMTLGRARLGTKTEARLTATDRAVNWLQRHRLTALANPLVIGVGAGVAGLALKKTGYALLGAIGASSLFGGLRRKKEVEMDRAMHIRERAIAYQFSPDKKRRTKMEQYVYQMESAINLAQQIESITHNPDGSRKANITPAEAARLLPLVADVDARMSLSEQFNIDLISFESMETMERNRLQLMQAVAEAKALSRAANARFNQDLADAVGTVGSNGRINDLNNDVCRVNKDFRKFKALQVLKGVGEGAAIAAAFGLGIQGIQEGVHLFREHVLHQTNLPMPALERWGHKIKSLFADQQGIQHVAGWHEDILGQIGFKVPDGYDLFRDQNNLVHIFDSQGNDVFQFAMEADGTISDSTKQILYGSGWLGGEGVVPLNQPIPTGKEIVIPAKDWLHRFGDQVKEIARLDWFQQNTPKPKFDLNELKVWLGGINHSGLTANGDLAFSIGHMARDGSFQDGLGSIDVLEELKKGTIHCFLSLSRDLQKIPIELPIDPNTYEIIIPKGSDIYNQLFKFSGGKFQKMLAQFLEIAWDSTQTTPDGRKLYGIVSTFVGDGINEVNGQEMIDNLKELCLQAPGAEEMAQPLTWPWFIPIYRRKALEGPDEKKGVPPAKQQPGQPPAEPEIVPLPPVQEPSAPAEMIKISAQSEKFRSIMFSSVEYRAKRILTLEKSGVRILSDKMRACLEKHPEPQREEALIQMLRKEEEYYELINYSQQRTVQELSAGLTSVAKEYKIDSQHLTATENVYFAPGDVFNEAAEASDLKSRRIFVGSETGEVTIMNWEEINKKLPPQKRYDSPELKLLLLHELLTSGEAQEFSDRYEEDLLLLDRQEKLSKEQLQRFVHQTEKRQGLLFYSAYREEISAKIAEQIGIRGRGFMAELYSQESALLQELAKDYEIKLSDLARVGHFGSTQVEAGYSTFIEQLSTKINAKKGPGAFELVEALMNYEFSRNERSYSLVTKFLADEQVNIPASCRAFMSQATIARVEERTFSERVVFQKTVVEEERLKTDHGQINIATH